MMRARRGPKDQQLIACNVVKHRKPPPILRMTEGWKFKSPPVTFNYCPLSRVKISLAAGRGDEHIKEAQSGEKREKQQPPGRIRSCFQANNNNNELVTQRSQRLSWAVSFFGPTTSSAHRPTHPESKRSY
mmetsp:Transcript_82825/g.173408  ORF Transcript_82825/g.173408 Transcript_82825/m.173408 type:complete len:130 (-) Transcript_82825:2232-2621(-)